MPTSKSQLTNSDRCDRCGSRAYVHIVMPSGNDLMFCGHHWTDNKEKLESVQDVLIHDESDRLTEG